MPLTGTYRYGLKYDVTYSQTKTAKTLNGLNIGNAGGTINGVDANVAVPYLARTIQNFSIGTVDNARFSTERSLTF